MESGEFLHWAVAVGSARPVNIGVGVGELDLEEDIIILAANNLVDISLITVGEVDCNVVSDDLEAVLADVVEEVVLVESQRC